MDTPKRPAIFFLLPLAVLLFALFHLSVNDVDVDLWGHTLFGQRMLSLGEVERAEPFSWTAPGHRWINHELVAELLLGAAHVVAGGTGIWLLKTSIGLLVFGLCVGYALDGERWPRSAAVWLVAALGVVELAFGFAARPQIFTALGLALLLYILREGHRSHPAWFLALPLLLAGWINTHGGALAGVALTCACAAASLAESQLRARMRLDGEPPVPLRTALWLAAVVPFCFAALLLNPYGKELPLWLWESVRYVRPEIDEWNPVRFSLDHLPFLFLAPASLASLWLARRSVRWYEAAFLGALLVVSLRHARHVPLFAVAAIALLPGWFLAAGAALGDRFAAVREALSQQRMQRLLAGILAAVAVALVPSTLFLRKETFHSMEVPRERWPLDAIAFARDHGLQGNTVTFFDWGEITLWELPRNPPSIDGRLDTCYPRAVIEAHWDFYNCRPFDAAALDLAKADVAMVPQDLACVRTLLGLPEWTPVYRDRLAAVFVRDAARFPSLAQYERLPVERLDLPQPGRAPFPRELPELSRF
ncbi:MAG: hypothetical protein SF028_07125 [Candidatus Sumerlaeia bacterium]|nr:hypothetical protein [Candidatus Sumerlaeia bacterium]